MASQTYLSVFNAASIATITASGAATGYPASNIKTPERLTLPWRSLVADVDQWLVIDTGAVLGFDPARQKRVALIGANFASCVIQAHSADSWSSPDFTSGALTVGFDPDGLRYRRWVAWPGAAARRYTRIYIPAQTPVDGASSFELAGVWMGEFVPLPHGLSPGYEREVEVPAVALTAALGKWTVSYETGEPFARHRWDRSAEKNPLTPGTGDEWETWRGYDLSLWKFTTGRRFCYCVDNWGTGAVWVMRQTNTTNWKDDGLVVARDRWELEECVAG